MEKFYEGGLRFECKRCSFCCGHSPGFVYLSSSDLDRLCAHFKMTRGEFIDAYCRWAMYYGGKEVLALREMKNFDCALWNGGCSAYEARPAQCRAYPFWTWMIADVDTWNDCAKTCPGMNSGRLWTKEEIEEQGKLYEENAPLERR